MDFAERLRTVPEAELRARVALFQARLQSASVDTALVVQGADLLYLAGTRQQAHLVVPAVGEPRLLARKSVSRAARESGWETQALRSLRELPGAVAEVSGRARGRIGLELDVLPVTQFRQYEALWPDAEFVDVGGWLREQRAVKSPWELERLAEAAVMMDHVVRAVPEVLRPGMTEVEFAGRLEAVGRRLGHQGLTPMRNWNLQIHYGAVVTGPSGAVPGHFDGPLGGVGVSVAAPMSAGHRPIGRGEPIIVDYIMASEGYLVDQTRTFSLGPLPEHLVEAYAGMRDILARVSAAAVPGARGHDVYDLAVARAEALGLGEMFLGPGELRVSFVGHGVGLEVDELPLLARGYAGELAEGMVLAVEPKAIFPGVGAVGIENTTVVTPRGLQSISISSEELIIID